MAPRKPYKSAIYRTPKPPVKYRRHTASEEIAMIDTGRVFEPAPEPTVKLTKWQRVRRRWLAILSS